MQHGDLCAGHFLSYFEDKVFQTIQDYRLLERNDTICVAASGGKDSLTVLYLTKKYINKKNLPAKLFALAVDEGLKDYRAHTILDLKKFCKKEKIELHLVFNKKEFGFTLDEAQKKISQKRPCHICGVWRRYLLNKEARKLGATKLITGHNLDDEAQAILMNFFKANSSLSAHLGPVSGVEKSDSKKEGPFVQRIKPLYFCTEKETRLYAVLKKFPLHFAECPYANEGYRSKVRDMLNEFENNYPGTKQGLINSFLDLLPLIKQKAMLNKEKLQHCQRCGEPANNPICKACKIIEELQTKNKTKTGKKKK